MGKPVEYFLESRVHSVQFLSVIGGIKGLFVIFTKNKFSHIFLNSDREYGKP